MTDFIPLTSFSKPRPQAGWSISRREIVHAPPERVWQALIEPAELRRWWCDFAEVDARVGGRYAFGGAHVYGDCARDAEEHRAASGGEIIEFEPASRLEIQWRLHGVETRVAYDLVNHLESTQLTVTQTADCAPGWDPGAGPSWWWAALPALRAYVERGQPDIRLDYAGLRGVEEISFEASFTTFPWIIWHKLTNPGELSRWWARKAEVDARASGNYLLGLEGMGPRTILEIDDGQRLAHDWTWQDGTRGEVEWQILETDDDVRVSVRDKGPWSPGAPREFYLIYWASTLLSLKQMSEQGVTPREYQDG